MKRSTSKFPARTLAALLICSGLSALHPEGSLPPWVGTVQAAEDGHGGGHSDGRGGGRGGQSGGHDAGDDSGHDHDDSGADHEGGKKGGGKHGAAGGQGRGHDSARGGDHSVVTRIFGGGRPVWAQEGIPEVELGRLNVGRAPGHVLARAELEALSGYTTEMAALYNLSAEEAAALLQTSFRELDRFDSPLQNLALYKDVLTFGRSQLPGIDNDPLELAAIFLGSASDKNLAISEDTVIAINRILGLVELNEQDGASLAAKAETVRAAILVGHGPEGGH